MKELQKFKSILKHNFDFNISGPKAYEKKMKEIAKQVGFIEIDKKYIEKFKKQIVECLYEFKNGKKYDLLAQRIFQTLLKTKIVGENATVVIYQPLGQTSFPDFLVLTKNKFNYIDCKIYNKNGKNKNLYIGETLEKPLGIYFTFDQDNKEVNYFYGASMNQHLEQAYQADEQLKKLQKSFNEQILNLTQLTEGSYGGRTTRLIRKNTKKFRPSSDSRLESWEALVDETLDKPVDSFLSKLTKPHWGGFEPFIGESDK